MFGWLRKFGDRGDYQTPTPEPTYESRQAALLGVDIRLSELSGIPRRLRTAEQEEEIDRLVARRSRLMRPAPPVVPDRAEASIRNYQENP